MTEPLAQRLARARKDGDPTASVEHVAGRFIAEYAEQAQLCWQAPREATEVNDYDRRSLMAVAQESRVYARLSRDGLLPLRTPHPSGMTTEVQITAEALAASRYEAAYKHGPIPREVTS